MIQIGKPHPVHRLYLAVFFFAALAATADALAQSRQEVVYSVEGWPRLSTRKDGKAIAMSFTFGVQVPAGKPSVQDFAMTMPVGDPFTLFMRSALRGETLKSVLIEFPLAGEGSGPRAPFAARLTEVRVTSVQLGKSSGDAGPGIAEVKLQASRFEIFTGTQDPRGAITGGQQMGWDQRTGKAF